MTKHFTWQQAILSDDSGLPWAARYVCLVIGTYMNAHGEGAWPSIGTICEASKLSRSTVIRAIGVAEEIGWITVTRRRKSDGDNESNIYRIDYPSVTQTLPLVSGGNQPSVSQKLAWCHTDTQTPQGTPHRTQKNMSGKPDPVDNFKDEKREQEAQAAAVELVRTLNIHSGRNFKPVPSTTKLIRSRMKEYGVMEIAEVIERKCKEWKGTKMEQYLRPETLFNATKFAGYAGQLGMELSGDSNGEAEYAKWWESAESIGQKGQALGMAQKAGEAFWQYKVRVAKRSGERKAMDAILADLARTGGQTYSQVAEYFGVATKPEGMKR